MKDERTLPAEDFGATVGLGASPESALLRAALDDMQAVRDRLREIEGREPDVWQYATAIVGTAIHKAQMLERERCAAMCERRAPDNMLLAEGMLREMAP